tara:strand:- start:186 stop:977 length:792 start_codon:yes stop_codon:yes gene_type:complete
MLIKICKIFYLILLATQATNSYYFGIDTGKIINSLKHKYYTPIVKRTTSVITYRTDDQNNKFKSCIVFFTGGSSFISPKIYEDFFNELLNINIDVYVPSFNYSNFNILVDYLNKEYKQIILAGHSSGATVALKKCENENINDKFKKLILFDPVNTRLSNTTKPFKIKNIDSVLYLNALKSYEITYDPFGLPFIPIFKIPPEMLVNDAIIKVITAKNYGHGDILNKEYGDLTHNTRLAVGNKNRSIENINNYHKWLVKQIKIFE